MDITRNQVFDAMNDLRVHLKVEAMRNNCAYKLKESRPARLEAVCPSAMEDRNEESDAASL